MVFFKRLLSSQTSILLKQNSEGLTNHNIKRKWLVPGCTESFEWITYRKGFCLSHFLAKKKQEVSRWAWSPPQVVHSFPHSRGNAVDVQACRDHLVHSSAEKILQVWGCLRMNAFTEVSSFACTAMTGNHSLGLHSYHTSILAVGVCCQFLSL